MSDAWAFGTLFIFSLGLGTLTLRAVRVGAGGAEFFALAGAAGLGLTAVLAGALALAGALRWERWFIPLGAAATLVYGVIRARTWRSSLRQPLSLPAVVLVAMLAAACLGAVAPTTDDDSLAYPVPIAQHLANEGRWRFWPDQARSTLPLSQQTLLAIAIDAGGGRFGLLSAVELVLSALFIVSLGRRAGRTAATPWIAGIIGLGCPAVAFLAASAKEDLLLLTMTLAAAVTLTFPPSVGAAVACGLFAGLAAGAKYSGAPIAIAILACVPFCCGRQRPVPSVFIATVVALMAGGIWYAVNIARFGNPVAPFMPSVGTSPMAATAVASWLNGFGSGRGVVDAALAPFRLFYDPAFGGRGNWINPLAYVGVAGALIDPRRRTSLPLLVIAGALYASWFASVQVSRLLLPAVALLSVPAADVLTSLWDRVRLARYPIAALVGLSAGIVVAVGLVRFERYLADPATFLARETQHYDSIEWMNMNLDPGRDRVATWFKSSAYLEVPWLNLDPSYQVEISPQELDSPTLLEAALKRQGVTYVFGPPHAFAGIGDALRLVRANPASRLGGTRFFRTPFTGSAEIYAIK